MKRDNIRLKITFADNVSLELVEESVASNFSGFGGVACSASRRTIFLTGIYWPYDYSIVTAQLSALAEGKVHRYTVESYKFWDIAALWSKEQLESEEVIAPCTSEGRHS